MKTILVVLTASMLFNATVFAQPNFQITKPKGSGHAVLILDDGKILVGGSTPAGNLTNLAVVKYKPNGTLDKTFGVAGKAVADFGRYSQANSLALQADGKIVAAGSASNDFAIARFKPEGTLDSSFGTNGKVRLDFNRKGDEINFVAIQPDNKILVTGTTEESNGELTRLAVVRYKPDGTIDSSFGKNGKIVKHINDYGFDFGSSIILQSGGKIVIAGYSYIPGTEYDFVLIRFNQNGKIDSSFGINGLASTDFNGFDLARAAAVQSNGKIVVIGYSDFTSSQWIMARYTKNGLLDSSFGTNGKTATTFLGTDDKAYGIAIQPDDKIVVVGSAYNSSGGNNDFAIARYTKNGQLDNHFSHLGKITSDFGITEDVAYGTAIQQDGRIVIAGYSDDNFALERYNADGSFFSNAESDNKYSFLKIEKTNPEIYIKLYPNPVQSILNIQFNKASSSKKIISIFNVDGKLVLTKTMANSIAQLDVKQLTAGIYLIKINDADGTLLYSGKVVKQQ